MDQEAVNDCMEPPLDSRNQCRTPQTCPWVIQQLHEVHSQSSQVKTGKFSLITSIGANSLNNKDKEKRRQVVKQ
jgi:hypothetical protein